MTYAEYDPDRFDAEILLERSGLTAPFTARKIGELLGCVRSTINMAKKRGAIPAPAVEGSQLGAIGADEWSFEQVIDIMVSDFRKPKPIEHGTPAGFAKHRRRGIPACEPCRQARNAYQNATRKPGRRRRAAA